MQSSTTSRLKHLPFGFGCGVTFTLSALSLTLAGCFNPSLPDTPFYCAKSGKPCPDGYSCQKAQPRDICVKDGIVLDSAVPDTPPPSDASLLPSKEGPVFLDGALVQSSAGCADEAIESSGGNNSFDTAFQLLQTGLIPDWEICYPGDVDHYRIKMETGKKLTVEVIFTHKEGGDLDAALLNPKGFVVRESRSETNNEKLELLITEGGDYVFGVYGFGDDVGKYDLKISIQ